MTFALRQIVNFIVWRGAHGKPFYQCEQVERSANNALLSLGWIGGAFTLGIKYFITFVRAKPEGKRMIMKASNKKQQHWKGAI